jgi:hypothetical protein
MLEAAFADACDCASDHVADFGQRPPTERASEFEQLRSVGTFLRDYLGCSGQMADVRFLRIIHECGSTHCPESELDTRDSTAANTGKFICDASQKANASENSRPGIWLIDASFGCSR